jgi:hypothetical protein
MRSNRGGATGPGVVFRAVALVMVVGLAAQGAPVLARQADDVAAAEYDVKAVFIHHFTRYLTWPRAAASGPFEIAIVGESAIVAPLRAIAARETVHGRPIAIRTVADIEFLGQPQILFIARSAAPRLSEVLKRTQGRPILTISEEEGLAAKGTAVNFILRGESIKFEINEGALRESDIEAGSQLLRLAILVKGPR